MRIYKNLPYKKRVGVLILVLFISFFPPFSYLLTKNVSAGTFSPRKVTISDSRASATATYDYAFTATTTTNIKQIDLKFCTQAGAWADTCTAPTGLSTSGSSRASDNIAGTGRTDSQPGANSFRTVITTPASQATQAITFSIASITNPSTTNTTFFARFITWSDTGSTEIDSGEATFAILTSTSLAVTATINETLSFSLAAATSGNVNGAAITVTSGTSASTIPFGTLAAATPSIAAHDVTVTTNASGGYTVTVKTAADPPLVSGSENIDKFTGTNAAPAVWSSPNGSSASVNTGFFGYTTEDATLGTGTAARFTDTGNEWAGATTSPLEVIYSATGVSSQTTRVGWQAEVNAIQPAGSYTGTVVMVATPTY